MRISPIIIDIGSRYQLHRFMCFAARPVCHKRVVVVQRPLADDPRGLQRQRAVDDCAVGDADEGGEALVAGVEMRRRMVGVVHADHDAEDGRDDGHGGSVPVARRGGEAR
jgi:hypothetical protein